MGINSIFSSQKKTFRNRLLFLIAIFVLFGLFYVLNYLFPLYIDDWIYSANIVTGNKLSGFKDIVESQYSQYMHWGGRSVVHTIDQFLLWAGGFWCDLFNTLAFVALCYVLYKSSNINNPVKVTVLLLIAIFIWFFIPAFSQNLLWITGSANYLWGTLLVASFMYIYIAYYLKNNTGNKNKISRCVLMTIFGLLAGWTNENISIALLFFLIVLVIILRLQKRIVPLWMYCGIFGVLVGSIFMLAAPGNFMRNQEELYNTHKVSGFDPMFYLYRMVTVLKLMYVYLRIPIVIYAIMMVVFWLRPSENNNKKQILTISLLLLAMAIVATLAMAAVPIFPDRAWFGIYIYLIWAIAILYANIAFECNNILLCTNRLAIIILLVVFLFSYRATYQELKRFNDIDKQRTAYIEQQKAKGIKNIVIEGIVYKPSDNSWLNVLKLKDWVVDGWIEPYGRYMGVETIIVKEDRDIEDLPK